MSRHRGPVPVRTRRRWFGRDRVELLDLGLGPDHYTRLWPTRPDQSSDTPLFLAFMLPARLAALALLWVTAAPARLLVAVVAASALAVLLLA